jgi:hypothetical protein
VRSVQLSLIPTAVARVLGWGAFLLVLACLGAQVLVRVTGDTRLGGVYDLFDLNNEWNIPTFYSALLLLFAAIILAVIAVQKAKDKESFVRHWTFLSLGFLYMALDEAMSFHERLVFPIRQLFGDRDLGYFNLAWVIPAVPLILILGLCYLPFLLHLPWRTRICFIVAAFIYLSGAVGFEMLDGRFAVRWFSTVEESLEMAGAVCFIWALLKYVAGTYNEVQFHMEDIPPKPVLQSRSTVAAGFGLVALVGLCSALLLPAAPGYWFYPARSLLSRTGQIDGEKRVAVPGRDACGFLSYGPYISLAPGQYVAAIRYSSPAESTQSVGRVDVCAHLGACVLAEADLPGAAGRDQLLLCNFELGTQETEIEARLWYSAVSPISLKSLEIRAIKKGVP